MIDSEMLIGVLIQLTDEIRALKRERQLESGSHEAYTNNREDHILLGVKNWLIQERHRLEFESEIKEKA